MGETASKLRSCKCQLYRYHFQQGARLCQWQRSDLDFKLGVSDARRHPGKTHLHFRGKAVGIRQRWPPPAVVGGGPWWARGETVFSVCNVRPGSQHLVIWGGVPSKVASSQSLQPFWKFCEFSDPASSYFYYYYLYTLLLFSCSIMSDSLWSHGL